MKQLLMVLAAVISIDCSAAQVFDPVNAALDRATFQSRDALHLVPGSAPNDQGMLAILEGSSIHNGVIDLDVAGAPLGNAPDGARGFIGVAFRVQPAAKAFECFYIRPTNGRADDQLRRNHSTQYISFPDFPWYRLRKESPAVYESYTDLEPAKWTHLRVVIDGTNARLYVNGATQPALIVHDLKLGDQTGAVAFWASQTTDAWFANLKVEAK